MIHKSIFFYHLTVHKQKHVWQDKIHYLTVHKQKHVWQDKTYISLESKIEGAGYILVAELGTARMHAKMC